MGAIGVLALVAAACSSNSSSGTTTTSGSRATGAGNTARPATVAVAPVGSLGPVLVTSTGLTLYRFTPDGTGKSVCTGGCASLWPPLLVAAGATPVAGTGVTGGALGTLTRSDGTTQVTYNGMPLYTYTGDKKAGDANGQNVAGTWFVISTSSSGTGASGGTGTTTTTKAAGSGGYGY